MKSFITSVVLIVIIVPVLCSGLKCYTCDPDPTIPNNDPAPCTVGQVPVTRECTTSCYIAMNVEKIPTILGCTSSTGFPAGFSVFGGCVPVGSSPSSPYISSSSVSWSCNCARDLCNNPYALKCLACEGNPVGFEWGGKYFQTDYMCKKGEIPTERLCYFEENHCFKEWNSTQTKIGCRKTFSQLKYPYYFNDGTAKIGICKPSNCNTELTLADYEIRTKTTKKPKTRNIGEMKSPWFSLVFTVAVSYHYTITNNICILTFFQYTILKSII